MIELVVVIAILAAPQMNISQFRITSILVLLLRIFLKKEKKYSTLEAAYNAYEKLLTEGEYVKYKDTLPKL